LYGALVVVGCFGGSCNHIKILCNIRLDPTKKKIDYKLIGYDSADAHPKAIYALKKMMNTKVETQTCPLPKTHFISQDVTAILVSFAFQHPGYT